ncbi:MAG TPA: VOC family protein [Pseudonocardiaceae bacterium]|nr:VOC family protein [Pseudonocardiaceae bacterium]
MSFTVENVVFDCADPYQLAGFWSRVTGWPLGEDDEPGDPEVIVRTPVGPTLFFQRVPEPKAVKNRLHLCLRPDGFREGEVERLIGLGASMVDDRREANGLGWVVLADPEGNEFCVLRGIGDRQAEAQVSVPD